MGSLLSLAAAVAALPLGQHASAPATHAFPHASVAAAKAGLSAVATPAARHPKALLRELRACGKALYNAPAYKCLRDERRSPLASNGLYCTVTIYAYASVRVRFSISYGGEAVFTGSRTIPKRTIFHLAVSYELPIVLPAGHYTCTFTAVGKSVRAKITGGGQAGAVVEPAVCSPLHLSTVGNCTADESAAPLAPTSSLTCSGYFVGRKGRFGAVELVYNNNGVWTSMSRREGSIGKPIIGAFLTAPSAVGQTYAPGQYACRFSVDGQTFVEKPFTVRT
jgi:hypothetical protein